MAENARSGVSLSHALFLVGGLLLGFNVALLLVADEPNVVAAGGGIVVALCTIVVGQQTAKHGRPVGSSRPAGSDTDPVDVDRQ